MKRILLLIFVIFLLLIGQFFFSVLKSNNNQGEVRVFTITKGQNLDDITQSLVEEEFIANKLYFKILTVLLGQSRNIKAGMYAVNDRSSIYQLVLTFSGNNSTDDLVITIPEGFNIKNIEERIERLTGSKMDVKNIKIEDYKDDFDFLADVPQDANLEGFIFPDTYRVKPNFTIENLITKALENFDKKLTDDLKEKIKEQDKSIYEMITMASLIEKEIPDFQEREVVSGILWKRLGARIALQVDATVAFITGKRTTKLTLDDLKFVSPYNTYLNLGLPPGPIANPGIDAIKTAIFPKKNPYLYYLSKPNGETVFSETLDQHNAAKAKYLR